MTLSETRSQQLTLWPNVLPPRIFAAATEEPVPVRMQQLGVR